MRLQRTGVLAAPALDWMAEVVNVRVHEVMSTAVVTVTPHTTVLAARRLLESSRIRHLPVIDGETLVGIVSDRDLMAAGTDRAWTSTTPDQDPVVESVMSAPVQSVWPDDDVLFAARQMLSWKIDALPVMTNGRVVGIVTSTDLLRALVASVEPEP